MDFRQRKMHAPVVIKSLLFIYDFYIAGVVAQQTRRWFEYFRKEQFTSETTKPKMVWRTQGTRNIFPHCVGPIKWKYTTRFDIYTMLA